jgi:hypothetical protein
MRRTWCTHPGPPARAKSVAVQHAGLANTATAPADLLGIAPAVHVAQFSAWSWDACAAEIWTTSPPGPPSSSSPTMCAAAGTS